MMGMGHNLGFRRTKVGETRHLVFPSPIGPVCPRQKKSIKRDDDEEMDDNAWKPGDDSPAKNPTVAPRKTSVSV